MDDAKRIQKTKLSPERWALVKPDAFLTGSIVQARNVIEMALHDIAVLHAEVLRLQIEAKIQRVERVVEEGIR